MKTLIHNATIVNEGRIFVGSLLVDGDSIADIAEATAGTLDGLSADTVSTIDATGMLLLPGVIDTHVHFRDGGLADNPAGNFATESRAARAGGVTSVIDMPNTNPPTVDIDALEAKERRAAAVSAVNYGFMVGATATNLDWLLALPPSRYAAIKLFLGSSTGNMLLNDPDIVDRLFRDAHKLIVAHCEEEAVVQANMHNFKLEHQGKPTETAALHPQIRNNEACFLATYKAVARARKYGTRLHIAHLSTATELSLLSNFPVDRKNITAEVTPNHLFFDTRDYDSLGNLIKCNPAIKSPDDRLALWAAIDDGLIDTIATDHAPHTMAAKQRPYFDAPSGIPSIQHSLQMMLEVVYGSGAAPDETLLTTIVEKMCHNPATLFGIEGRGYLRRGYKADLVLVRPGVEQRVDRGNILYGCGWSPIEGQTFHTCIERVWVNGSEDSLGQPLAFNR